MVHCYSTRKKLMHLAVWRWLPTECFPVLWVNWESESSHSMSSAETLTLNSPQILHFYLARSGIPWWNKVWWECCHGRPLVWLESSGLAFWATSFLGPEALASFRSKSTQIPASYFTSVRGRYGVWPSRGISIEISSKRFEFRETTGSVAGL